MSGVKQVTPQAKRKEKTARERMQAGVSLSKPSRSAARAKKAAPNGETPGQTKVDLGTPVKKQRARKKGKKER